MASKIADLDNKIALVIGNLLSKADPTSKSILTAFDTAKDVSVNCRVLSGSRFSKPELTACAQFLKIKTEDHEGDPIFSNKPSLAKRIVLEIQSLCPTMCAACDSEYSVKFDSDSTPARRCFLCFQGCHDCEAFSSLPTVDPASIPLGTVWLCSFCHEANNPTKPPKNKLKSSKNPSRVQSGASTPAQNDSKVSFNETELLSKLTDLQNQTPASSKQSTPNHQLDDICELFKVGKCPHGVSGKTASRGVSTCSKLHPRRCTKFTK